MLGDGAINVAEVALAKVSLDAGDVGFGVLVGAGGLGLTIGSFVVRRPRRQARRSAASTSTASPDGGRLRARGASRPTIYVAVPARRARGFGNGAAVVCNALFVQRGAPDELRGRAFTVIMSLELRRARRGHGRAPAALTDALGARWVWGARRGGLSGRRGSSRSCSLPARRDEPISQEAASDLERPAHVDARRARRRGARAATGARSRARSRLVEDRRPAVLRPRPRCSTRRPARAYAVGVTGPPGVGKSSLISALVRHVREAGTDGRRDLGRPVEPVHAGRAARRPDPALRSLPRSGRLHPLDGDARPPRRARARRRSRRLLAARRGRQGPRLPRDRRRRPERGRGDRDRRHGRCSCSCPAPATPSRR